MNTSARRIWVSFDALRERLPFEQVLQHYKVTVVRKGDQHQGPCPLPNHGSNRGGTPFSANLTRNIFQCFECKAKGNVLDFAAMMEGADPEDGKALRKVALGLQQKFFPEGASSRKKGEPERQGNQPANSGAPQSHEVHPPDSFPKERMPIVVNEPMDFQLQGLNQSHPFFSECGLRPEIVAYFGLGFCERGMLKGRIATPLHDSQGRLIGYAGLESDPSRINEDSPEYLMPSRRERIGKILDFQASLFLYNQHRIEGPCERLHVVQDIASVWWLNQNGVREVVAIMGNRASAEQVELAFSMLTPTGSVCVVSSGDDLGAQFAESFFKGIKGQRMLIWADLGRGFRPTDLTSDEIKRRFRR